MPQEYYEININFNVSLGYRLHSSSCDATDLCHGIFYHQPSISEIENDITSVQNSTKMHNPHTVGCCRTFTECIIDGLCKYHM